VSGQQPSPADWRQTWAAIEDCENLLCEIAAWLPGEGPGGKVRDAVERCLGSLNVAAWQAMRQATRPAPVSADGYRSG
jgi:hypothetical protein